MAGIPPAATSRPVVFVVVARIVLAVTALLLAGGPAQAVCDVVAHAQYSTITQGQVDTIWGTFNVSTGLSFQGCCFTSPDPSAGLAGNPPYCGKVTSWSASPRATGTFSYLIQCQWKDSRGGVCNGSGTTQITVKAPAPKPSVSLKATPPIVVENDSVTLTWTASNATACTASCKGTGCAWSGAKSISGGSEILPPVAASATYSLNCTGVGGSKTASTTNTVFSAPANLGPTVNSGQDELMVTPNRASPNDSILFSRMVNGLATVYVAYSDAAGKTWSGVSPLPSPLNADGTYIDGIANTVEGRVTLGGWRIRNSATKTDLFESFFTGSGFTTPSSASLAKVNTASNDDSPYLAADSSKLLFASDRSGGLGSYDIWESDSLPGGSWGAPWHLDAPINSPYADVQPFLSSDGLTLFLSSTRGGNFDLYYFTWDGKKWVGPTAFAPPIDSASVQQSPAMSPDGKRFYFISNRAGGVGGLDIYMSVKK